MSSALATIGRLTRPGSVTKSGRAMPAICQRLGEFRDPARPETDRGRVRPVGFERWIGDRALERSDRSGRPCCCSCVFTWLRNSSGASISSERLEPRAGAADGDVAVVEKTAEQRLVDVDALDLVHVHLGGVAPDEAALQDDAAVGDGDLGGPALEPCPDEEEQGEPRARSGPCRRSATARRRRPWHQRVPR